MVRFKSRWMLVHLEFADLDNLDRRTGKIKWFPSREDAARATRNSIQSCFGTSASDAIMGVHGKQAVLVSCAF